MLTIAIVNDVNHCAIGILRFIEIKAMKEYCFSLYYGKTENADVKMTDHQNHER